jgi:cold shock CspA family protein
MRLPSLRPHQVESVAALDCDEDSRKKLTGNSDAEPLEAVLPASPDPGAPMPSARPRGNELRAGTVMFWHLHRNYGFIRPDDPEESPVWVSDATLDDSFAETFRHLVKGERVLYEAISGDVAPDASARQQAVRVTPSQERCHGVVKEYSFLHGHGAIESDDGTRYFLHRSHLLGDGYVDAEDGAEVFFVAPEDGAQSPRDPVATAVKLADPRPALRRFAQFPYDLEQWLGPLARRAARECWDYLHELAGRRDPHPILRHYLEQTFSRLLEERELGRPTILEGKQAAGRRYAVFNTGLVDDMQKPIYCLFDEHRLTHDPRAWWWWGFYTEDDGQMRPVADLPVPASYLDDPSALIITPDEVRNMRIDSRHIVGDNLDRFPARLHADPEMARKLLEGDLHELADRVRRNYKIAVPQYYRGAIQLLLPLNLGAAPNRQDLTLVVERTESGVRRACTVVGNDLAYRQSRIIARADPAWLGRAWVTAEDAPSAEGEPMDAG